MSSAKSPLAKTSRLKYESEHQLKEINRRLEQLQRRLRENPEQDEILPSFKVVHRELRGRPPQLSRNLGPQFRQCVKAFR